MNRRYRRRRKIRYRPANQRPMRIFRGALACVVLVAVVLSARVIMRSVRTAKVNRQAAALYTMDGERPAVEVAAPPLASESSVGRTPQKKSVGLTLAQMTMPDGSDISKVTREPVATDFHITSGDVLPDMLKLLKTNPDTVGWLGIDGIVHLPVVYRDNEYYLTHDFGGHHNTSGTLFLDQASPVTAQTQNLLIYGHSMYDGSMFGLLTHYRKLETLRQHPLIRFSTLWEKETYVIFAVLKQAPEAFDYYSHPFFASSTAFETYVDSVLARSIFDIPVDVRPTDALLTLSTCIDDDRLVVFARRIRADETNDELISAIEQSGRAIS